MVVGPLVRQTSLVLSVELRHEEETRKGQLLLVQIVVESVHVAIGSAQDQQSLANHINDLIINTESIKESDLLKDWQWEKYFGNVSQGFGFLAVEQDALIVQMAAQSKSGRVLLPLRFLDSTSEMSVSVYNHFMV